MRRGLRGRKGVNNVALYAIGDLHLSLTTNKPMDIFGPGWADHTARLEAAFSRLEGDEREILEYGLSPTGEPLEDAFARLIRWSGAVLAEAAEKALPE